MSSRIPDFKQIARTQREQLQSKDIEALLEQGRRFGPLSDVLERGGALLFPHVGIAAGGHHIAAVIHAVLRSNAETVLVLGVLHARTEELEAARQRVASGGAPALEAAWGVQGPGTSGRDDWEQEFSLDHFLFLWQEALKRLVPPRIPELVLRFPYLAGGCPERLPGIGELEHLVQKRKAVIVATGDLFHHGLAYGNSPEESRAAEAGGLDLARRAIEHGCDLLRKGDYAAYNRHSVATKSDARDVGQVLRHLTGPCEGRLLDLVAEDMTGAYKAPAPSWVAGALVAFSTQGE